MSIRGAEGLSQAEVLRAVEGGARLVHFDYAVSLCVISFARSSEVHLVRPGEGTFAKALPYNLLTLALGWWGFPFGPIFSVAALWLNLCGGNDVTAQLLRPRQSDPRIGWDSA